MDWLHAAIAARLYAIWIDEKTHRHTHTHKILEEEGHLSATIYRERSFQLLVFPRSAFDLNVLYISFIGHRVYFHLASASWTMCVEVSVCVCVVENYPEYVCDASYSLYIAECFV